MTLLDADIITDFVSLNLSTAVDSIPHGILLDRLEQNFAIVENALQWFAPTSREDCRWLFWYRCLSYKPMYYITGVLQRSVLVPILFLLFKCPIAWVIRPFHVRHHVYVIMLIIKTIHEYDVIKGLLLSPAKSEALIIGTSMQLTTQNRPIMSWPQRSCLFIIYTRQTIGLALQCILVIFRVYV